MNESVPTVAPEPPKSHRGKPEKPFRLPPKFILAALAVIGCFGLPLYNLVRFALESELYSYVLLVPFVSVYLFSIAAKNASTSPPSSRIAATILFAVGLAVLGGFWIATMS